MLEVNPAVEMLLSYYPTHRRVCLYIRGSGIHILLKILPHDSRSGFVAIDPFAPRAETDMDSKRPAKTKAFR